MDPSIDNHATPPGIYPPNTLYYLRELGRTPLPGGPSARIKMARAAADGIHRMWMESYLLEDYPPMLWCFQLTPQGCHLSLPSTLIRIESPLPINGLLRCFARWRQELVGLVEDRWLTRFLIHFLRKEPVDPGRVGMLFDEIALAARKMRPAMVESALSRYQRIHSKNDRILAAADFLADRHIPMLPDEHTGERRLAQDWLRDALLQGTDWYSVTAAWSRQLQLIEMLGFDLAERPLLRQMWLIQPSCGAGFPNACFQNTAFEPARKRWVDRPLDLPGELEEEIHRLRSLPPTS